MRIKRQVNGEFWWLKKPEETVTAKNKDVDEKQVEKEAEIEVTEKNGQGIYIHFNLTTFLQPSASRWNFFSNPINIKDPIRKILILN